MRYLLNIRSLNFRYHFVNTNFNSLEFVHEKRCQNRDEKKSHIHEKNILLQLKLTFITVHY